MCFFYVCLPINLFLEGGLCKCVWIELGLTVSEIFVVFFGLMSQYVEVVH